MINLSINPPKNPAREPNKTPINSEIITATNPIEIEILEPMIRRLNKSLPYLSVPRIKCFSFKYLASIFFLVVPGGN